LNLLLDSHVILWWLADDPRFSRKARRLIERADEAYVSAATTWELALKASRGCACSPPSACWLVTDVTWWLCEGPALVPAPTCGA